MKTQRNSEVARSDRLGVTEAANRVMTDIDSALCEEFTRFEQEYMGRRPQRVHVHLLGDMLLVRLQGVLTAAERELAQASPTGRGVILLKKLLGTLVKTNRPVIEAIVQKVAGAQVLSLHHDISTVTGEEVMVFTLDRPSLDTIPV